MSIAWVLLAATKTIHTAANNITVEPPADHTGLYILIAAIVTVVGTLIVAFIAAKTAGTRQKAALVSSDHQHNESLASADRQHKESLEAERGRLAARLQHERKQEDVQHLRGFLDEMAATYERAHAACREYAASMKSTSPGAKQLIGEREDLLDSVTGQITPEQEEQSTALGGQSLFQFDAFAAAARAEIAIAVADAHKE